MPPTSQRYASRGGTKLASALDAFQLDVSGNCCADLGANVGGFTDCLLKRDAAKVYAVDTGYGVLAWPLRQDPRVVTLERTNVLNSDPTNIDGFRGCDLVTVDLGWTRQVRAIPAALKWLATGCRIVSLIKPHYEADTGALNGGVLSDDEAHCTAQRVLDAMPSLGVRVLAQIRSPVRGGGSRKGKGNVEYLALLMREAEVAGRETDAVSVE